MLNNLKLIFLGAFAGFLSSLPGGPIAFLHGSILGGTLAAAIPFVTKYKQRNQNCCITSALMGLGFGALAGCIIYLLGQFIPDMKTHTPFYTPYPVLIATCALYGCAIYYIIGIRDTFKIPFDETFLLIFGAMALCHMTRIPPLFYGNSQYVTAFILAGFGNTFIFAVLWSELVIKKAPFYIKYEPNKKSAKHYLGLACGVLAFLLFVAGVISSAIISASIKDWRFLAESNNPELLKAMKGDIYCTYSGKWDKQTTSFKKMNVIKHARRNKYDIKGDYFACLADNGIAIYSLSSGKLKHLIKGVYIDFALSPDLTKLACIELEKIKLKDTYKHHKGTLVVKSLTGERLIKSKSKDWLKGHLCWGVERQIIYGCKKQLGQYYIFMFNMTNKNEELVTQGIKPKLAEATGNIAFINAQKIFLFKPQTCTTQLLQTINLTTKRHPLTTSTDYDISPDGRYLIYLKRRENLTAGIHSFFIIAEAMPDGKQHFVGEVFSIPKTCLWQPASKIEASDSSQADDHGWD